ncbi:MAG: hypothetical protein GXP32_09555 [Kiritimatiellaeota bacterium]|nr:hypothetical protein [Kiritimatiellota bacterium]
MDWTQYKEKPLVLFEYQTVDEVIKVAGYTPSHIVESIIDEHERSELFLFKLLENPKTHKDALLFFSSAMRKRERMWWGHICLSDTMKEVKEFGAAPPPLPKAPDEEEDASFIEKMKSIDKESFKPKPVSVEGTNLSDPSSWPDPALGGDGRLKLFPEPMNSMPGREKTGAEMMFDQKADMLAAMSPDERTVFDEKEAKAGRAFAEKTGMSIQEYAGMMMDKMNAAKSQPPFEIPSQPDPFAALKGDFARLKEVMKKKKEFVKGEIAKMKEDLPSKDEKALFTSDRAHLALSRTMDWILVPDDDNAMAAFEIGRKCKGGEKAVGTLAQSAFWSGTNLAPGKNVIVPPPPGLPARGVFGAVFQAAYAKGGKSKPKERLEMFLAAGIEVAQGLRTWEKQIIPENDGDPWSGKSGFGREYN